MEIEERQQSAVLADLERLIDTEQKRLASLTAADVLSRGQGKVLTIGAAMGRHVNAGEYHQLHRRLRQALCGCHLLLPAGPEHDARHPCPHRRQFVPVRGCQRGPAEDQRQGRRALCRSVPSRPNGANFTRSSRRTGQAEMTPDQQTGASDAADCPVGQLVTVTRDNGVVPSMSVTWRRLGHFVASWIPDSPRNIDTAQTPSLDADARRPGTAHLRPAFAPSPPEKPRSEEDRPTGTRTLVSR